MNKYTALLLVSSVLLSACTSTESLRAKASPTPTERMQILAKVKAESVKDNNLNLPYSWLYLSTAKYGGSKTYVDTNLVKRDDSMAIGYIKTLKTSGNYDIAKYRAFCTQGYGREINSESYTADHKKKFSLLGSAQTYDRPILPQHEKAARVICAIAGFTYKPE